MIETAGMKEGISRGDIMFYYMIRNRIKSNRGYIRTLDSLPCPGIYHHNRGYRFGGIVSVVFEKLFGFGRFCRFFQNLSVTDDNLVSSNQYRRLFDLRKLRIGFSLSDRQ